MKSHIFLCEYVVNKSSSSLLLLSKFNLEWWEMIINFYKALRKKERKQDFITTDLFICDIFHFYDYNSWPRF